MLACGFGLVPNLELPLLLGCEVRNDAVVVDPWQESSVPGVYCAGELTGIGGAELALIEGVIAGSSATDRKDQAANHFVGQSAVSVSPRPSIGLLPSATSCEICRATIH